MSSPSTSRLNTYLAIASTAAVGSAHADIVYHDVNTTIALGESAQFLVGTEVGLSAQMTFIAGSNLRGGSGTSSWQVLDYGYGDNYIDFAGGFSFTAGSYASLWRFNASTDIDSNNFNAQSIAWGASWNGMPGEAERAFAAFKIREGSVQSDPGYYGWIDISWSNDGTLTIHGYAYNNVLDGSIHVGDVPAPGALGLIGLAAGASGIRRKRSGN